MDWTTIFVSCIPAVISGTLSYFTARNKGKNDLKKAAQENDANITRLMKQHEIDIESLREKHKMEMEAKDKEQEHKLQIMQKEYELKIAENKAQKRDDITNEAAAAFLRLFMQDPKTGKQSLNALVDLQNTFNGKN